MRLNEVVKATKKLSNKDAWELLRDGPKLPRTAKDDEMDRLGAEWAKRIYKDCGPWIRSLPNKVPVVYRGVERYSEVKDVRSERKPLDTQSTVHKEMDDWFNEEFGHRYRSNAMFCTRQRDVASVYGKPYYVFPIGEFKVCWSPNVSDLSMAYNRYIAEILSKQGQAGKIGGQQYGIDHADKLVPEMLESKGYREGNMKSLFNTLEFSRKEIMVACQKYYVVPEFEAARAVKYLNKELGHEDYA